LIKGVAKEDSFSLSIRLYLPTDTMQTPLIDILMPTYNGAKYIKVLLDSLLAQTLTNWHLIVRDDNSKDHTLDILKEYMAAHPGKITLLDNEGKNIGINNGFSALLGVSTAPYACFCDQDDQWMEDKLEVSLAAMQELEQQMPDKPCLVFSDLCMVDENLKVIAPSKWKKEKLKPHYNSLSKLLVQNMINGCVMMMNKKLVDIAHPVPKEALWFDHWVAVLAAATGKVKAIHRTTINYRIHANNASIGENRINKTEDEEKWSKRISNKNFKAYFKCLADQAMAVQATMKQHHYSNAESEAILNDFLSIPQVNPFKKRAILLKHKIFKHSWITTFKWLVRI
jgi:glycosyltransferase involved in cell wall biosynthesis